MKRTFKISVKIKDCPIEFKEGMGKGVIITQEYTYDLTDKEYKSPMFALSLVEQGEKLAEDVIEIEIDEKV